MYPGKHAQSRADQPAVIMARSGETISYAVLEARTNRLAHFLRGRGLQRLDHYAIFMENTARYVECCGAGERAGLYYTCINSFLTADELAFIVDNSASKVLIFSQEKRAVALEALRQCPKVEVALVLGGPGEGDRVLSFDDATAGLPDTPIADEAIGTAMLYSSGTTGRPKGILRPLPEQPPSRQLPLFDFLEKMWRYREGLIYLSPAPLYHSAPQAAVNLVIRNGGTAIIMERFDPEHYLQLVERYRPTHSQLVPTMFSRMLKLPEAVRARSDLSSLEVVIHAAAPCPVQVKEQMIGWWGPIIHEYYGATEGLGFAACNSAQWLAHRGTVGKILLGELHVLDDAMQPCPKGTPGTLWFKTATPFEYFNDPAKTDEARSPDGTMSTVGDVGYVDDDGFLFLTDRATFMIVSGGVNIYPQECENLLITHPKVADAAVFGVPNEDLGEEVKAVVQVMPDIEANASLADELIAFCGQHLSRQKCPRSIDFEAELPRLPTGKLYKRVLRDRYWGDRKSKSFEWEFGWNVTATNVVPRVHGDGRPRRSALHVFSLKERPELREAAFSAPFRPPFWPEFMLHDRAAGLYYDAPHLDRHLAFAFVGLDGEAIAGRAFSVPFAFGIKGRTELPDAGWDEVIRWSHQDHAAGRRPTALSALEISLLPPFRGHGHAERFIAAMKDAARAHGFADLYAPVRPSLKHRSPRVPMAAYAAALRPDGLPVDPWLRTHVRLGGRIVKVAPCSMTIVGTLAEWSRWTGLAFPASGDIEVPGALAPVLISREQDCGVYVEPNVWMHHRV